jgi:uncharacterized damage-inducible protein DinB
MADAFAHHCWATLQLLDACAALTPEQLTTAVPGTYGPILPTLQHLVSADRGYLSLLSDGALDQVEEEALDLPAMRAVIEADAPVWQALLARDTDPDRMVVRHRDDGSESHAPLGIRLAQVVHHGTDHRSQVCTALTNLGITPPEIDAWDFALQEGRLTEVPAKG